MGKVLNTWTNLELALCKKLFLVDRITVKEIGKSIPRHSIGSITGTLHYYDIHRTRHGVHMDSASASRLRRCHEYFQRREQMLGY